MCKRYRRTREEGPTGPKKSRLRRRRREEEPVCGCVYSGRVACNATGLIVSVIQVVYLRPVPIWQNSHEILAKCKYNK